MINVHNIRFVRDAQFWKREAIKWQKAAATLFILVLLLAVTNAILLTFRFRFAG